jgi:hypothetical protein
VLHNKMKLLDASQQYHKNCYDVQSRNRLSVECLRQVWVTLGSLLTNLQSSGCASRAMCRVRFCTRRGVVLAAHWLACAGSVKTMLIVVSMCSIIEQLEHH